MKEKVNAILLSGGISLNTFWVVNLFKTANEGFKELLNFYPPIGPLLGVFLLSIIIFIVSNLVFNSVKVTNQKFVVRFYIVSAILFVFAVFPPIFEPIAHLFGGK